MEPKCKIIPYVRSDGIPTFRDSDIMGFYDRMAQERTADVVFHDGSIQSREQFLGAMSGPNNFLIVVYWEDQVSAIMWANRFQDKWAQNHFCCFNNVWGNHKIIHEMGRVACLYLLDKLGLDCLFSMIPEKNKAALASAIGAGATVVGKVPYGAYNYKDNKSESAVFISYTREGNEYETKDHN